MLELDYVLLRRSHGFPKSMKKRDVGSKRDLGTKVGGVQAKTASLLLKGPGGSCVLWGASCFRTEPDSSSEEKLWLGGCFLEKASSYKGDRGPGAQEMGQIRGVEGSA